MELSAVRSHDGHRRESAYKMELMPNHAKSRSLRTDSQAMALCHQVNSGMEFTLPSGLPTKPDRGCTTAPRTILSMPVPSAIALALINMRLWLMTQAAIL